MRVVSHPSPPEMRSAVVDRSNRIASERQLLLRVVGRLRVMNGATGWGGRRPTTLRERNRGPRWVRWRGAFAYGDLIATGCRWRCERRGGRARCVGQERGGQAAASSDCGVSAMADGAV